MEFVCRVGTVDGRVLDQVHQARDERALRKDLEGRGLHVFAVRRRGVLSRLRRPALGGGERRLAPRKLLIFNQELASLLRSGLPLLQGLDLMSERERDPFFREMLAEVRDQVRTGRDLSDAFAGFGDAVPGLYPPTLKAGERSGQLEQVIRRFVRYQKLLIETRKKVVSALVYPAVLIGLSLALIGVMTIFVVPRFTEFYSALGSELPLLTRATLGLSSLIQEYWLLGLLLLAVGLVLAQRWRATAMGAVTIDRWKLALPFLGAIFQKLAVSEFCRSLSTLLAGGIPVVAALESSVKAVGNAWVRVRLEPIIRAVREGKALYEALDESRVSPEVAVDMIRVGEATGALDEMLASASDFLDEEVDTRLQRILSLLEPVMLVLMGTIVALLLISVYLPLFSLLGEVRS